VKRRLHSIRPSEQTTTWDYWNRSLSIRCCTATRRKLFVERGTLTLRLGRLRTRDGALCAVRASMDLRTFAAMRRRAPRPSKAIWILLCILRFVGSRLNEAAVHQLAHYVRILICVFSRTTRLDPTLHRGLPVSCTGRTASVPGCQDSHDPSAAIERRLESPLPRRPGPPIGKSAGRLVTPRCAACFKARGDDSTGATRKPDLSVPTLPTIIDLPRTCQMALNSSEGVVQGGH
jgi:hypothetical protein